MSFLHGRDANIDNGRPCIEYASRSCIEYASACVFNVFYAMQAVWAIHVPKRLKWGFGQCSGIKVEIYVIFTRERCLH